ncbi:MAG: metal ABC transporter substrate-binding protein [Microthrixaceae bacterium]|nr:metal ABC transporter substrate-binding protein [Microthrixaceae bacterium]
MRKSGSYSDSRFGLFASMLAVLGAAALLGAACGSDSDDSAESGQGSGDLPRVVVTTNILGDVVSNMLGDAAEVETVMPAGADPHEFQASAQQVDSMTKADVIVTNGAGFEEGLEDIIESVESGGTPVCVAIDSVETIEFASDDHDHSDEEHSDEEHEHEHEGVDPHFFTDPARMAVAAEGLTECILEAVPALDTDEVRSSADEYIAELEDLDAEVETTLAAIPEENRVLITNHEVFGYFADRYGFEVAGVILPQSTQSEADAAALDELAELIEAEGVPAVFADTSAPNQLAEALAAEAGEVAVVELFSESLGPDGGETYVAMVQTNAERIADALS